MIIGQCYQKKKNSEKQKQQEWGEEETTVLGREVNGYSWATRTRYREVREVRCGGVVFCCVRFCCVVAGLRVVIIQKQKP